MTYQVDINDIPSVEVAVAETPAQGIEFDDEIIKFSNITVKTSTKTVQNFTVLDVETTGLSPEKNEIIEVCAIKFRDGRPIEKFSTLTAPRKAIPPRITKINGITNDMVKECPHFSLIADSLVDFIGDDNIVGHNLEFDLSFIMQHGANVTRKKRKYYDTLTLSQRILKRPRKKWNPDTEEYELDYDEYDVENYKLATLCEYYHIPLMDAHRAAGDSCATGFLFLELADEKIPYQNYNNSRIVKKESPEVGTFNFIDASELMGLPFDEFSAYCDRFSEWSRRIPEKDTDANLLDIQEKQLAILNKEVDRRIDTFKSSEATSNAQVRDFLQQYIEKELFDSNELQSWPDKKFFSWCDEFIKYCKTLPDDIKQGTGYAVQYQLKIIREESARREKGAASKEMLQEPKDWADKIKPILPLVYVLWFCGIAVGTFSLLHLIFA